MILTCPECATSYFVDDARIPPEGRRVKCSTCGNRWTARLDEPARQAPAAETRPAAVAPAAQPDDDLDIVAVERPAEPEVAAEPQLAPEPTFRSELPRSRRRRASAAAPRKGPGLLVWAGVAALVAALVAGAIVFREQVAKAWPASSSAYAALGLPVIGGGLVLEQVHVEPAFLAGRPVLSVTGAIRNVRDVPVDAPPVRVTLLNRAGKPVEAKIARPVDATIPARARRHFAIAILDPPATARDLEVRFDVDAGAKRQPRAAQAVLTPAPGVSAAPPPGPASEAELPPHGALTEHG